MKPRVNRTSMIITGVVATISVLVIGASAFAGGGSADRVAQPRTLAVSRLGRTLAALAPGATRDIAVLDAGTITITVDSAAAAFSITAVVPSSGWTATPSQPDPTHASAVFTNGTRRVVVTMAFESGVLTVTITEVPQDTTTTAATTTSTSAAPATTSTTTAPTTTTAATTTTSTTAAPTTTTGATTTTTVAVSPVTTTCTTNTPGTANAQGDDEEGDDQQGDECDDKSDNKSDDKGDEREHTTTASSTKASTTKTSTKQHKNDDKQESGDD